MFNLKEDNFIIKKNKFNIPIPDQHWQLRDLLKRKNNELIFCQEDKVMIFHPTEGYMKIVMNDLSFYPVCMNIKDNIVLVGGIRGQYALKNLSNGNFKIGNIGPTAINSIRFWNNDIYLCTNNNSIMVYDINMEYKNIIPHKWFVNNCEFNHSGSILASVGDSSKVDLFDVRNGFKRIQTLQTTNDSGFKISWDPNSIKFAVCTQDGYMCLFDIRNYNKELFKSKQMGTRGSCRNTEYSISRLHDLLIFTEHKECVHIIDSRNYEKEQIIRIKNNDITGCCFMEDKSKIYIGTDKNIFEYEILSEKRRTFGIYDVI